MLFICYSKFFHSVIKDQHYIFPVVAPLGSLSQVTPHSRKCPTLKWLEELQNSSSYSSCLFFLPAFLVSVLSWFWNFVSILVMFLFLSIPMSYKNGVWMLVKSKFLVFADFFVVWLVCCPSSRFGICRVFLFWVFLYFTSKGSE